MADSRDNVIVATNKQSEPKWRRYIPSFTTLLLIGFFIIALKMNGDIKPLFRRGFFCGDTTLNYPFKQDTIGVKTLLFFALILPGIVIRTCDNKLKSLLRKAIQGDVSGLRHRRRKESGNSHSNSVEEEELMDRVETIKRRTMVMNDLAANHDALGEQDSNRVSGTDSDDAEDTLFSRIPLESEQELIAKRKRMQFVESGKKIIQRSFTEFQLFFFGLATTMLFTGIGKITCGRHRPHFMTRCKPDVDCSLVSNANRYIENFSCTNSELGSRGLSYISTSWPSGHASIMFYSMLYVIIYLETVMPAIVSLSSRKVKERFDSLVLYAIYVLMLGLAGYIALTRVSDYHHHPRDVFSGCIIGIAVAFLIAKPTLKQYYDRLLQSLK